MPNASFLRSRGKDYSHRKELIRQRLEEPAGFFCLEMRGFAVLIFDSFFDRCSARQMK
jgi:hypothetical protein